MRIMTHDCSVIQNWRAPSVISGLR